MIWETSRNKLKRHSVSKIDLTFHFSNELFQWSKKCCRFFTFSLECQKFFSITKTFFSHRRSEQFWKQNTIFLCKNKEKVTRKKCKHLQLSGRLHVSFYTMMRKFLRWRTQSTIVCSSYGCWTFGDSFLSLGETLSKWQRPEHVMQR